MAPTIIVEPRIEDHAEELYQADRSEDSDLSLAAIGPREIDRYRNEGYLVLRGVFDAAQVKAARDELIGMCRSGDPRCEAVYYEGTIGEYMSPESRPLAGGGDAPPVDHGKGTYAVGEVVERLPEMPAEERARHVRKLKGFVDQHPPLAEMARRPELLALIERLVGGPVKLYSNMALIKPPNGREKPWHQDHAYYNLPLDCPIVGVWIALDAVDRANGCMYLLPGAHRGPIPHFKRRDWQICDRDVPAYEQIAAPMSAGDVLLFDGKLPHGTPRNRSDRQRWAVQYHYIPEKAAAVADEVRLSAFGSEGKNVEC